MQMLLEFLIISLQTLDGVRHSGRNFIIHNNKSKLTKKQQNEIKKGKNLDHLFVSENASKPQEKELYLKVIKMFNKMRVRMKLSYMAFQKGQTVKEMFLETILQTFTQFKRQKLPVKEYDYFEKSFLNQLLEGQLDVKMLLLKRIQKQQEQSEE